MIILLASRRGGLEGGRTRSRLGERDHGCEPGARKLDHGCGDEEAKGEAQIDVQVGRRDGILEKCLQPLVCLKSPDHDGSDAKQASKQPQCGGDGCTRENVGLLRSDANRPKP
jgi:hypothetical protein